MSQDIDVDELAARMAAGAVVVDVREPGEYAAAHVPGTRLIPMGELGARIDELERDRTIHLICATGNRSGAVSRALEQAGYDAVNVAGGTDAWMRSGRPVERGL